MAKRNARSLGQFRGTLVLVGAGKMGSALLDGWLARGLKPKQVTVIEPQPAKTLKALARRGLRINPKGKIAATAIVVAEKPQKARDPVQPLGTYVGQTPRVLSIIAG